MMVLRSIGFIASAVLAYALLRGWPDSWPGLMRACAAVLALVGGLGLWAWRGVSKDETHAKGRRVAHWLDYTAIGAAVLALECGFLWLLGTAPKPLESIGMLIERQFRPEAAAMRAVSSGPVETRSGNWLWTRDTRRPLPRRTDFKPGTKPEVFLRLFDRSDAGALLKGKVYVRAFALGRYENAAWSPLGGTPQELRADAGGFVRISPDRKFRSIAHEVFHSADPGGQNVFTALQGATLAGISPLQRLDEGLHLLPASNAVGGYQYHASSQPLRLEDLPDGELLPWPNAPDEFRDLPAEPAAFMEKLRTVARSAAGGGTLKQQLLQIQNHLRTTLDYSLETDNALDLDPIENFLFQEKRGHCEYFATAGALMARALGVPSRVAYGWAGGKWFEESGLFVFRANEAHAWTEVWLEDHGWVLMDPTPQSTGMGDRAQVAAPGEALPNSQSDPTTTETITSSAVDGDFPRLALALMVGFALPAGVIAWWRGRRARKDERAAISPQDAPGGPSPGYLKSWRHACAARGMPMPAGFTLRRQVALLPEEPDFAAELLRYHYATRYEGRPPDESTEKQLTRRIRQWEAQIPALDGISGINADPPPSKAR
jgi:transglutaminase-like putative cysteine protease